MCRKIFEENSRGVWRVTASEGELDEKKSKVLFFLIFFFCFSIIPLADIRDVYMYKTMADVVVVGRGARCKLVGVSETRKSENEEE